MNDQFDALAKGMAQSVTRRGALKKFGIGLPAIALAIVGPFAVPTAAHADTLTVLNALDKGAGSLRSAITGAKNGDVIVFHPSLAGSTISLTSDQLSIKKNLVIEGPGAALLTISGNDKTRVFDIAEGSTVTIAGLTIAHGRALTGINDLGGGGGGGILNAGKLTVTKAALSANQARSHGGAIANAKYAVLTVVDCTFIGNRAIGKGPGADSFAEGGAVYNANFGAIAHVISSTFISNYGIGADGGVINSGSFGVLGQCNGGAIHNGNTSILTVERSTFIGNQALGGNGGNVANVDGFGYAGGTFGGAIANDETCPGGYLLVSGCTFAYNEAIAGSNNVGSSIGSGYVSFANGGAIYPSGVASVIKDSTFIGNQARGGDGNTGGPGVLLVGVGMGGAINNGNGLPFFGCGVSLTVSGCSFTGNQAVGGAGNSGGTFSDAGIGGAIMNLGQATVTNCTLTGNQAIGGAGSLGGKGGNALGGGLANLLNSTLNVANCTVTGNEAFGGAGGVGANGGDALGGGVFNGVRSSFTDYAGIPSALTLLGSRITMNQATGGAAGAGGSAGLGVGGGAYSAADGVACLDLVTGISANAASTSNNDIFGIFTSCP